MKATDSAFAFKLLMLVIVLSGTGSLCVDSASADDVAFEKAAATSKPRPSEYEPLPLAVGEFGTEVTSIALSPDESRLAIGDFQGRVRILNCETHQVTLSSLVHSESIVSIEFSPTDDDLLVTGGFDGRIHLLSLKNNLRPIAEFKGHKGPVTDVDFAPDGNRLASCGYDKTVRCWNVKSAQQTLITDDHKATVRCVEYSPDGKRLLSAGDDRKLKVRDPATLKPNRTIERPKRIWNACFSTDGKLIAVSDQSELSVYEQANEPVRTHRVSTPSRNMTFLPHTTLIAAGDQTGDLRLWTRGVNSPTNQLEGHRDLISGVVCRRNGKAIYSAGYDGRVNEWPARLPIVEPLTRISVAMRTWDTAISKTGDQFAAAGRGGLVEIRSLKNGKLLNTLDSHKSTADRVQVSKDGSLIATAGWKSSEVVVRNVKDGSTVQILKLNDKVRSVCFSPNGKKIAAVSDDLRLTVFDLENGTQLNSTVADKLKLSDVAWSPDGSTIVTSSGDWAKKRPGELAVWRAESLTEKLRLDGHTTGVASVTFHPDGHQIASASKAGRIKIWDLETATQVANLGQSDGTVPRMSTRIRSIEFSPNGEFIAAAMYNGNIQLWDIANRRMVRRLGVAAGVDRTMDMFSVRFSPDGSVVCGASGQRLVTFWDISDLIPGKTAKWVHSWSETNSVKGQ